LDKFTHKRISTYTVERVNGEVYVQKDCNLHSGARQWGSIRTKGLQPTQWSAPTSKYTDKNVPTYTVQAYH